MTSNHSPIYFDVIGQRLPAPPPASLLAPHPTRNLTLVLSPTTRGFWDLAQGGKDDRGVLSEGKLPCKPDITKAKQVSDQSKPMSTTTIKTDTSFPLSLLFKFEKEKEKDAKSVTSGSEGAASPVHAKKCSIIADSFTSDARD
ncbi:hypothetical protein FRC11_004658 [Ceratobasidium sp. 423]|nr:hypothetical protein FRC11_004658 [Ceratobasidium sp. 423]